MIFKVKPKIINNNNNNKFNNKKIKLVSRVIGSDSKKFRTIKIVISNNKILIRLITIPIMILISLVEVNKLIIINKITKIRLNKNSSI